jgi:DNA polymerase iota
MTECDRVIVHIDVDAFYAQVEELKQPSLATRPMGVTQKHIVVTCNYPARSRGVTKLMTIKDALNLCPELITINGEDLTPYRAANKALLGVLRRYGTVQKGGLDEALIDITGQVTERLQSTAGCCSHGEWKGRVCPGQDLESNGWPRLRCGATIADEMRRVVRIETGLRTSAGIASNPLLAKLASSVHKPDDQTIVVPSHAAAFVENLPVSAIPGVGARLESTLRTQFGATHVHHLRNIKTETLERAVGNRQAAMLAAACWGLDPSPVTESSLPKTIGVEDSFPKSSSSSTAFITAKLTSLAADLFDRVNEESKENSRMPTRLVLTWRVASDAGDASPGWKRRSASCEYPHSVGEMVNASTRLLRNSVAGSGELTLLGLGASGFTSVTATSETSQRAITNFLSVLRPASADKGMKPCTNGKSKDNHCVIHCDVDCFYCAVERVDDPSCIGRPIVVSQFHGGGFVSVSYEAREAGIRCGDGAGGGGRVGVQHLVEMGARSVKECLAACPGLVIKPMRPQRYRQMSDAILDLFHSVLRSESIEKYAIEKSSCDDYYVKIWMADKFSNLTLVDQFSGICASTVVPPESGNIDTLDLKLGAVVAHKMKSALKQQYGMTASCGVARNKLLRTILNNSVGLRIYDSARVQN